MTELNQGERKTLTISARGFQFAPEVLAARMKFCRDTELRQGMPTSSVRPPARMLGGGNFTFGTPRKSKHPHGRVAGVPIK